MGFFERFKPASDDDLRQLDAALEKRDRAKAERDYSLFKLEQVDIISEIARLEARLEYAETDEERRRAQEALEAVQKPFEELLSAKRKELGLVEEDID